MNKFYTQVIEGATKRINELTIIISTLPAEVDRTYYVNELAKAQSTKARYEGKLNA